MLWNYIVDIAYILVALAIVILFAKKGFVESVFRFGRYIAAAIFTYFIGPTVSGFLYQKWIFHWIATPVANKIENFLNNTVGNVQIDNLVDSLPALVKKFVDTDALKEKYGATVESFGEIADEFSASVSAPLAGLISNVLAYISVFLLSLLVLGLLFLLLNKIFKTLPALHVANCILGAVFGVLAAFLTLSIVTWLVGLCISLFGSGERLALFTENSRVFGFFQNLNIFNLFN